VATIFSFQPVILCSPTNDTTVGLLRATGPVNWRGNATPKEIKWIASPPINDKDDNSPESIGLNGAFSG
jgi:hypothetical protein